ncbi:Calcineurin B-like protein 8 [Diplonema papillatum]|nr:Calcineurin B-like protein 8 [Diplonema papillatum]
MSGTARKVIKSTRRPGLEEAAKIRLTFAQYDKDGDGGICQAEFSQMLNALGIKLPAPDCDVLFAEMDVDDSAKIEMGEFLDHYYTLLALAEQEEARVMQDLIQTTTFTRAEIEAMYANFKRISRMQNDDGIIDGTEFKLMMQNGNIASWDTFLIDGLFRTFDIDKSGGITFYEFVKNLSIYQNKVEKGAEERDRLLFQIYDVDGDGLLSESDVTKVLTDCLNSNHMFMDQQYVKELVRATFAKASPEKDAKLSFSQYQKAMGM